jgi:SAM-dependent methyltransferase
MSLYDSFAQKKKSGPALLMIDRLYKKLDRIFSHSLPHGARTIVEVGSGDGRFAEIVKKRDLAYEGYEPNAMLAEMLEQKGFIIHRKLVPPFVQKDSSADAVVFLHVLEHMKDANAAFSFVREVERVLKPGGLLFCAVPNFWVWGRNFYNVDYTHSFEITELRLTQLVKDAGLKSIKIRYYNGHLFGSIGRICDRCIAFGTAVGDLLLPRKIMRSEKISKLRIMFKENILLTAVKPRS